MVSALPAWSRCDQGQSTLEYLLVALALSAIIVALCSLQDLGSQGVLGRLATQAASHAVSASQPIDALLDVLMY